jgi:hypothetical protein
MRKSSLAFLKSCQTCFFLVGRKFVSITVHKRPGPLNPQFKVPITLNIISTHVKYIPVPNQRSIYKRRERLADWIKRVNDDVDEPEIEQVS